MTDVPAPITATDLLAAVVERRGGQRRAGQEMLCNAIEKALAAGKHIMAEAHTGTGKSFAYLVPSVLHAVRTGKPVVVSVETKVLQEQLVNKDLPFLSDALEPLIGRKIRYQMLKGRSNYLCLAALADSSGQTQGTLDVVDRGSAPADPGEIEFLAEWARTTATGDKADLPAPVRSATWNAASVSAAECPGASSCSLSEQCFAEKAKRGAQVADVIVVNTTLYTLHLASGGKVLPDHDVVVVDEAHTLRPVAQSTLGAEIRPSRLTKLGARVRGLLPGEGKSDETLKRASDALGDALKDAFDDDDPRIDSTEGPVAAALTACMDAVEDAVKDLDSVPVLDDDDENKVKRAARAAEALAKDVTAARTAVAGVDVAWIEEESKGHVLRVVPIDIGPLLQETLFDQHTVVMTSATLTVGGTFDVPAKEVGFAPEDVDGDGDATRTTRPAVSLMVESPFDYAQQALMWIPSKEAMPARNNAKFNDRVVDALVWLIEQSRGGALALFTSRKAMENAAAQAQARLPRTTVLVQDDVTPKGVLVSRFRDDPDSCLFATKSFWQGVDVPGESLRLVVLDKLPLPRPNEPIPAAQRDAWLTSHGYVTEKDRKARWFQAWRDVDLPYAARLLSQGVGRLIRATDDRGVIVCLDWRLAEAGYRNVLTGSLPPIPQTRDPHAVAAFFEAGRSADDEAGVTATA